MRGPSCKGVSFNGIVSPDCRKRRGELLSTTGAAFRLSKDDLVILMHQGYEFLFLNACEGDDPRVQLFVEGDESPTEVASSFSSWLSDAVADEVEEG